ncbi:LIM homeobox transcription factor 1-beta-like [Pyrgilauda ruficollis]|uniref:LIM homeobox transcription factor 1-beta-like n=1 Tax=Pyrgilauda ruficollis TaxID=221976 RepID=UPI001B86FB32|nr:LIM homeobox transcription factor 1-beta-like [Pyrgilauda ruficollis]
MGAAGVSERHRGRRRDEAGGGSVLPGAGNAAPGSRVPLPVPLPVPVRCAGCGRGIRDRFLLRVNERSWHERCLRCSECGRGLRGRCFSRERRLLCGADYDRLFPRRCSRCLGAVGRSEPILRLPGRVFHERCLRCGSCGRRLRRGDEFVLRDGRVLCRGHAEPRRRGAPGDGVPPAAARSEDEEGQDSRCSRNSEGKDPKRSKRPRTILSSQQRRAFKASFEVSSKPCRKVRETLAAETGLTVRVVQVWFQNQRAKMKKIARRQQQQEQLGNSRGGIPGGRGSGRSGRDGNEDEEGLQRILVPFSRIPPPLEPNGFGSEAGTFRGATPPELRPYDSEGVFQELDGDALGSLGAALIPTENSQQLILGNGGIPEIPGARDALERLYPGNPRIPEIPEPGNPMERLYSMQSSYFTS